MKIKFMLVVFPLYPLGILISKKGDALYSVRRHVEAMIGYQVTWQDGGQIKKILDDFSIPYRLKNQVGQLIFLFPQLPFGKDVFIREVFSLYASTLSSQNEHS